MCEFILRRFGSSHFALIRHGLKRRNQKTVPVLSQVCPERARVINTVPAKNVQDETMTPRLWQHVIHAKGGDKAQIDTSFQ